MANISKLEQTKLWVNKWRQDNGVGPNVTPAEKEVPFKWMYPYLKKVQSEDLKIASTIPGDSANPISRNEWMKIMQSNPKILEQIRRTQEQLKIGPFKQASIPESYRREGIGNRFDQILNPNQDFSRPSLQQLREGRDEKLRTGQIRGVQ